MAAKPIVIFDFDGTLADSGPIIRRIYSEIASKNKLTVMTDKDYALLRRGSLREARKWSGVRFWQFPLLVGSVRKLMKLESEKVQLFPGVPKMIHKLRSQGIEPYILSRNASETIQHVLERYGLQDDLQILYRRKRSFGSKSSVINELVQRTGLPREAVWMIGDEVRDIQAAKRAGVKSIAVSWGLQDISILERYHPDHLVSTVGQLQKILISEIEKNKEQLL